MNLIDLFTKQKELDEMILDRFPNLRNEDLLPKKILSLQVELGELAQEWRGFKFWSENQKPRTRAVRSLGVDDIGVERGEAYNPLLEEFVDCLHFILSIGNELIHRRDFHEIDRNKSDYSKQTNVTDQFNMLFSIYADLWDHGEIDDPYHDVICVFLDLGEMLGFTWNQIESAYTEKWNINKKRQESGY